MGTQGDRINRNDLAEIVDRVSIPLPDVKLIADLFDEMVAPSGGAAVTGRPMSSELHHHGVATSSSPQPYIMPNTGGGSSMPPVSPTDDSAGAGFPLRVATSAIDGSDATVPFEAFLARMNYKIQGRYPHDAVRQVYLSLLRTETTTVGASSSLSSQQAHRGSGTEAAGDNTPITAASSGVIASKITLQMEAAQQAANALISSPASGGVPRGRAIAEGLWLGLGIRLSPAELLRLTNLLGIGQGDNALLQLTDFSSLVAAATGQLTKEEQEALAA
ncbi:Hypothetical protein, putative [Bodo saltans]|nr:Hypothetical protein, putative [Bodo saltans]|eukprot:CUG89190.1 Hypothetical protein, putative [Bodo saltans]